jgi:hypothetical protein
MDDWYETGSLVIKKAKNGFVVTVKGDRENQEDGISKGNYVFANTADLGRWIGEYYKDFVGY